MPTLMQLVDTGNKRAIRAKLDIIRRNTHAKGYMSGLIHFLREGDVCVDCGANIGLFTKQFADKGATVIAFEPDPVARKELIRNTEGMTNVEIVPAAVGAKNGELELFRDASFDDDPLGKTIGSTIIPNMGGRQSQASQTVKVLALHQELENLIVKHGRIRLLKIDIEGAEVEVLEELINRDLFKYIDVTLVETHEKQRKDAREKYAEYRKLAQENPDWALMLDWV